MRQSDKKNTRNSGAPAAFWEDKRRQYLKYYRGNRLRGIGTVGLAVIVTLSIVITFVLSPVDYAKVMAGLFAPKTPGTVSTVLGGGDVSSEEPESGFQVTVKFTVAPLCSEPGGKKKLQNTAHKGQSFEVLETSGEFYRIEYIKSCFGWIDKYYVVREGQEEPALIDPHQPTELTGSSASALKKICQDYSAMGVGVAVIKDGTVQYTYSYGYANKQQGKKINADTKFRPASLSKIISTLSTMTLVDAGKLDLDRNVEDYFHYKFRNPFFPKTEITPRMLLNHTSSLDDEYIIYTGSNAGERLKDLVVNLKSYKSQQPGKEFSYSNSGFGIVGSLDEVITNMPYIYFTDSV
ncbi:MAG: beta-lactamase family protein, partial [Clostridia bacterium]|nr:beta-lactamase family protein [Clostridia bacterium]